jgi:hypothetical protein
MRYSLVSARVAERWEECADETWVALRAAVAASDNFVDVDLVQAAYS